MSRNAAALHWLSIAAGAKTGWFIECCLWAANQGVYPAQMLDGRGWYWYHPYSSVSLSAVLPAPIFKQLGRYRRIQVRSAYVSVVRYESFRAAVNDFIAAWKRLSAEERAGLLTWIDQTVP